MADLFNQVVLLLLTIVMNFPSHQAMTQTMISDQVGKERSLAADCPYPCLPPPISGQICPPPPPPQSSTPTPPPPSGGSSGSYYQPPSSPASANYPPSGYFPYYPPPSYINYGYPPPPPARIMPYFPYYYRNSPTFSSASSLRSLEFFLTLILLGSFAFFICCSLFMYWGLI